MTDSFATPTTANGQSVTSRFSDLRGESNTFEPANDWGGMRVEAGSRRLGLQGRHSFVADHSVIRVSPIDETGLNGRTFLLRNPVQQRPKGTEIKNCC